MSLNKLELVSYEPLGRLPDLFCFDDGREVKTREDWAERRRELYREAVELQYGTMPPKPEYFKAECLHNSPKMATYRITAGTQEKQVTFSVRILKANDLSQKRPAVVDGDLCFNYWFNDRF